MKQTLSIRNLSALLAMLGIALLAYFGPHSLRAVEATFRNVDQVGYAVTPQLVFAALGIGMFVIGELIGFVFCFRPLNGKRNLFLIGGRAVQIAGLMAAMLSLWRGMGELSKLASPNSLMLPSELEETFRSLSLLLFGGLIFVFVGQIAIGVAHSSRRPDDQTDLNRKKVPFRIPKIIIRSIRFVLLLLVLSLFIYATIFDFELASRQQQSGFDIALFSFDFQGMMIYPFLAYFLTIIFCVLSIGYAGLEWISNFDIKINRR